MLKYIHSKGYQCDSMITYNAAKYGFFEIMKYALENNFQLNEFAYYWMNKRKDDKMIQYVYGSMEKIE